MWGTFHARNQTAHCLFLDTGQFISTGWEEWGYLLLDEALLQSRTTRLGYSLRDKSGKSR
jgi:hypothetical protein